MTRRQAFSKPVSHAPLLVLYDAECGLCQRSRQWVESLEAKRGTCQFVDFRQCQAKNLPSADVLRERIHVLLPDGGVLGGALAVAQVFRHLVFPWPWIGMLMNLPAARPLSEVTYQWVARQRHLIFPPS